MSDLPPASNKKPDGCLYPRCACNDSFCKEGNPMSEEKAEYVAESTEPRSDFKREEKYLVIKIDDAREYLTSEGQDRLREIASYIDDMRRLHGKRTKQFVCISDACPYYDEAWALVEKWVTGNTRPEPEAPVEAELVNPDSDFWCDLDARMHKNYGDDYLACVLEACSTMRAAVISALHSRSGQVSISRESAEHLYRNLDDGADIYKDYDWASELYEELKQSLEASNER